MQRAQEKAGEVWPVSQSYHYPLSPGLEPGTRVKLLSYDHGYWTVEANGKQFVVSGPQVDAGYGYELKDGRWLPVNDPRVIAEKKAWANQSVARTPLNLKELSCLLCREQCTLSTQIRK